MRMMASRPWQGQRSLSSAGRRSPTYPVVEPDKVIEMLQTGLGLWIVQDPTHSLRIASQLWPKTDSTADSRVIASWKAESWMGVSRGQAMSTMRWSTS